MKRYVWFALVVLLCLSLTSYLLYIPHDYWMHDTIIIGLSFLVGVAFLFLWQSVSQYQYQKDMFNALQQFPLAYLTISKTGNIIHYNDFFARMSEYEDNLLKEISLSKLLPVEFRGDKAWTLNQKALQFGNRYDMVSGNSVIETASGKTLSVFFLQISRYDYQLKSEVYDTYVINLTADEEWSSLKDSTRNLKNFFDKSPVGILMLNKHGVIIDANHAFETMLNGRTLELRKTKLIDIIEEENRYEVGQHLSKVYAKGNSGKTIETRFEDNRDLIVALFANRNREDGHETTGLVVQCFDITDRKNLEERFSQSQKMQAIGQLAGGIAHDFNNLLTAMIGFCDLLLIRHKPGDPSFSDVMQIKQNANRAANLVRQLLAFSRKQTLKPTIIDVTDILTELSHLLRRLIGVDIELKISHARDLAKIKADKVQLEQVIINLAVNARDAMSSGGELHVTTANIPVSDHIENNYSMMPSGDYILVEVTDTGVGIPKENLNRIFEPFFSTKEVGSGTGLGLSTVYGIVKQTGGFIFVDSEMGKGTSFKVYFPQHDDDTMLKTNVLEDINQQKTAVDLTGIGRILFVEDEDAVRTFATRALQKQGYEIIECPHAIKALEVYEDEGDKIDLIITDIVMPQMDGPTLIKKIRDKNPDQKIICISGYAEETLRERLHEYEDVLFLPKPFSLKKLAVTVKQALEG